MTRNATVFVSLLVATLLWGTSSALAGNGYGSMAYNVVAGTYSEITGGTVHATGSSIYGVSASVTMPFSFNFNGSSSNQVTVYSDGYINLGSGGNIRAWQTYITGTPNGELSTTTLGTNPNQVFVIQWKNVTRAPQGSTNDVYNFQIRLEQATGRASVVYGPMSVSAAVGAGIGAYSYNGSVNLHTSYWNNTWMYPRTTVGNESIAFQNWGPASGLTYVFGAPTNNDAAVVALENPSDHFNANTTQTVRVRVKNMGSNRLDSVVINWTVNGVTRTAVRFYPQPNGLQPGDEEIVELGNVTFGTNSFNTLMIRTSLPNGANDANPGNDTWMGYLAPRVSGRLNLALNGNPGVFGSFNDVVRHLYASGLGGNVDVHIFNGEYDQQIIIPQLDNSYNGGTLTFMSAKNNTPKITWAPMNNPYYYYYGWYENARFQVTLENTTPVAFKNLTFELPENSTYGSCIGGQGYGSVTVDNCILQGGDNPLSNNDWDGMIYLYSYGYGANFTITNNTISNARMGVNLYDYYGNGSTVAHNMIENVSNGVNINGYNANIHHNMINAIAGDTYFTGIYLSGGGDIEYNSVAGDLSATPNSYSYGIEWQSNDNATIINNMVAVGSSSGTYGIYFDNYYSYPAVVYHNSVNVTGTAGSNSAAFYLYTSGYNGSNMKSSEGSQGVNSGWVKSVNNIFHNAGTGTNGGYAVYVSGYVDAFNYNPFMESDFNDLMTTGRFVGYFNGDVVRDAGSNPLGSWRTRTDRDDNSSSVAVNFVGGSDLHLLNVDRALFGAASLKNTVRDDIDGEARTIPYMGADEIKPSVKIIQQPQSRYACLGESFNLICVADVTSGADVTYQWYKDGVELTGQTGAILNFGSIGYSASGVYTCLVKAADGYNLVEVMSDDASVIVVRPTSITVNPNSQPVAINGTAVLEVVAEAIGAPTNFVPGYQWKKRYWSNTSNAYVDTNVVDNGRITGAQSSQLTIRNITENDTLDTYVCEVTGYCGNATSKPARLFIPIVAASNNTPNVCQGGTIQLEVSAYPSAIPGSNVVYQWYFNGTAISEGGRYQGTNGRMLEISAATTSDAGDYLCHISYVGMNVEIPSNAITVVVGSLPTITGQPVGDTVCAGETVTLAASGAGTAIGYQWLKGNTVIPGATSATYEFTAAATDAGSYSVIVANACGSATSTSVDVVVNTAASVTTQPADVAVFDGDKITLTVAASGTEPITYQWYRNDAAINGATSATYETTAGIAGDEVGEYYCIVTNACGADTSEDATVGVTVGVDEDVYAGGYGLSIAMPNPTSDVVNFTYTVPATQNVRISLTNVLGNEIATIVNERIDAGMHRVEISAAALNLAPGLYTYTITSNGFMAAKQFIVVK